MRVVLTGGGTGGHIYPALAVAREFAEAEVAGWVGRPGSLEAQVAAGSDLPFYGVAAGGMAGGSLSVKARGAWRTARGVAQARRLLTRLRPDVVLATGGYVAAPVGVAAALSHVPLVLVSVDAEPGLANRLLARFASRVAVAWPETAARFPRGVRGKVVITGTPVRPEVAAADRAEARSALGIAPDARCLLVFGGSNGAAALNQLAGTIARAPWRPESILWVCGTRYHADLTAYGAPPEGVRLLAYAQDMPRLLAAADLALTRAGAVTLAELAARGLPAVLVPSPHVAKDHQTPNAAVVARAGAAVSVPERRLEDALTEVRRLFADPAARAAMAAASAATGRPDAARQVARLVRATARPGRA